jgi:hypothetical protein
MEEGETLFVTIDGVRVHDCDTVFVVRKVPKIVVEELKVLSTSYDQYRNKGYFFFSSMEAAVEYFSLGKD